MVEEVAVAMVLSSERITNYDCSGEVAAGATSKLDTNGDKEAKLEAAASRERRECKEASDRRYSEILRGVTTRFGIISGLPTIRTQSGSGFCGPYRCQSRFNHLECFGI
jgi:hypothetical protein